MLPFPPSGDVPDPGIEPTYPVSPALQAYSLPLSHWGMLYKVIKYNKIEYGDGCMPVCILIKV